MEAITPRDAGTGRDAHPQIHPAARRILILAPPVLLLTTWLAFNGFVTHFGFRTGYLLGFLVKWAVWCTVVPLWLLGPRGWVALFRSTRPPVGRPGWLGWSLLAIPLVLGYAYAFPRALAFASLAVFLLSALIALVNGTLEEVLWRGTYVRTFPGRPVLAWLYPSLGFGLWHLGPQSVSTGLGNPGGTAAFVGVAALFGLCWGWVAYRTGSIRWTAISHVLLDFAGLGGRVYLS